MLSGSGAAHPKEKDIQTVPCNYQGYLEVQVPNECSKGKSKQG